MEPAGIILLLFETNEPFIVVVDVDVPIFITLFNKLIATVVPILPIFNIPDVTLAKTFIVPVVIVL